MDKPSIIDFIEKGEEFSEKHDQLIAEITGKFIARILPDGKRAYKNDFFELSGTKKILIDSLIKKALHHKLPDFGDEVIKPKELSLDKNLGISLAVAQKVFNRELRNFTKKIKGGYVIPNNRLVEIK